VTCHPSSYEKRGLAQTREREAYDSLVKQSERNVGSPSLTEDGLRAELSGLGIRLEAIEDVLTLAREIHGAAKRDDGTPYLDEHVFPIAREVAAYLSTVPPATLDGDSDVVGTTIVALLHDSLEDCASGTKPDVRRRIEAAYGEEVLGAVETLTKKPKEDYSDLSPNEAECRREDDYMRAIRDAPYLVRLVKVFDRINNLRCIHKSPQPGKSQQYVEETLKYHLPLASEIDPSLADAMRQVIDHLRARD
jgi:(p)ppGpp synthase/HD superfamily hydrolase